MTWRCLLLGLLAAVGFNVPMREVRAADELLVVRAEGEFVDVLGDKYRLPAPDACRAVVLLFVGHDCPISNGYAPEVVRLTEEYAPRGVSWCVVYADADLTRQAAREHAHAYGYRCPAILDPELRLARQVQATVKPEAAVLSPQGVLLYRGRIDDRYVELGKQRAVVTRRELREALEAVLAGKEIATPRTTAVGCDIDFPRPPPAR